ncbi:MAG: aromatic-ring-hydroxylating dioxygenase subunit beta [Alphaproteobacteria bacterium]|nr:aromatic-ring-hydroxylating dioxygenase subunit beta [Alphaproteobacteria bacterium]
MVTAPANPSETSHYITDAYYTDLVKVFADWDDSAQLSHDTVVQQRAQAMLYQEARYLDQGKFKEWLDLFAPECAYWIPGSWERGDPRREITFAFHDRRQLEDRVYRLETGYAWSQHPASRTNRLVSNIEVFQTNRSDVFMIRSNFNMTEFLNGELRPWVGYAVHRVQQTGEGTFKILAKQVNLINCDQNIRNPSVTL